ncbi:MAG: helix-turn-helix domain-containing protein [Pseudomonadota bacterium]
MENRLDAHNDQTIGDRIRFSRKSLGLSQAELAGRVGVSQPAIANWESGAHDPRRIMMAKLAHVLDAPVEWLAEGERSGEERDPHPAAAYLRRPVRHVPVINPRLFTILGEEGEIDPHHLAEDYMAVTASDPDLFAVLVEDRGIDLILPRGSMAIVDYGVREPSDGVLCMAVVDGAPVWRKYRSDPARLEAATSDPSSHPPILMGPHVRFLGAVHLSIQFH